MAVEKKDSSDFWKTILTIAFPLITAIATINYQYTVNRKAGEDTRYRELVSQLTSEDANARHSAVSSLGTYLHEDDRYFEETVDILAGRAVSESNYNVRNTIVANFKKLHGKKEYPYVIDRLLTAMRNFFLFDYQMSNNLHVSTEAFKQAQWELQDLEYNLSVNQGDVSEFDVQLKRDEVEFKKANVSRIQREYSELQAHRPTIANMVAIFLSETRGSQIAGLEFFKSDMNSVEISGLNLTNTLIRLATFSSSTMTNSVFDASDIQDSYFAYSIMENVQITNSNIETSLFTGSTLIDSSFYGSTFKDVFFALADVKGADFSNVSGLRPVHFYGAYNVALAKFDDPSFPSQVSQVTAEQFKGAVYASDLETDKQDYVLSYAGVQ